MSKTIMIVRILALSVLAPLVLLAACSSDDDATSTPGPAAATTAGGGASTTAADGTTTKEIVVTANDFSFSLSLPDKPGSIHTVLPGIEAAPGQEVKITFENNGAVEHSFTVGGTDVTEAVGGAEGSGSFTVARGETEFHCKYHPTLMKGTIYP